MFIIFIFVPCFVDNQCFMLRRRSAPCSFDMCDGFGLYVNLQKQCHVSVYRMVWHSGMSLWRYFSFFMMACVPSQIAAGLVTKRRKAHR